jgi:hypothetical protein
MSKILRFRLHLPHLSDSTWDRVLTINLIVVVVANVLNVVVTLLQ